MTDDNEKENLDSVDPARVEREANQNAGNNISMKLFKFVLVIFILVGMGMCTIKYIS